MHLGHVGVHLGHVGVHLDRVDIHLYDVDAHLYHFDAHLIYSGAYSTRTVPDLPDFVVLSLMMIGLQPGFDAQNKLLGLQFQISEPVPLLSGNKQRKPCRSPIRMNGKFSLFGVIAGQSIERCIPVGPGISTSVNYNLALRYCNGQSIPAPDFLAECRAK